MTRLYGTVRSVDRISPSMLRVVFDGEGLDSFASTHFTDQYVNALFVPPGAPYSAPFDPDAVRKLAAELRPRGRRFTVRQWDEDQRLLTIDFVAHGDVGFAGRWAQRATVGDRLQMTGPSGGFRPNPAADWHLMVGDESALPAICASLEVVAPDAKCVVLVVVDGPDNELELLGPRDLDVRWLHRCTSPQPETLLEIAVAELDWCSGEVDVFVHGEASEVRGVRRHLFGERGVSKDDASISPYWRRDHSDEAWRAVKRQWLADQSADV